MFSAVIAYVSMLYKKLRTKYGGKLHLCYIEMVFLVFWTNMLKF